MHAIRVGRALVLLANPASALEWCELFVRARSMTRVFPEQDGGLCSDNDRIAH